MKNFTFILCIILVAILGCRLIILHKKYLKQKNILNELYNDLSIGRLVIDRSDKDNEPYLFLELDGKDPNDISKNKIVLLDVVNKNYVSH